MSLNDSAALYKLLCPTEDQIRRHYKEHASSGGFKVQGIEDKVAQPESPQQDLDDTTPQPKVPSGLRMLGWWSRASTDPQERIPTRDYVAPSTGSPLADAVSSANSPAAVLDNTEEQTPGRSNSDQACPPIGPLTETAPGATSQPHPSTTLDACPAEMPPATTSEEPPAAPPATTAAEAAQIAVVTLAESHPAEVAQTATTPPEAVAPAKAVPAEAAAAEAVAPGKAVPAEAAPAEAASSLPEVASAETASVEVEAAAGAAAAPALAEAAASVAAVTSMNRAPSTFSGAMRLSHKMVGRELMGTTEAETTAGYGDHQQQLILSIEALTAEVQGIARKLDEVTFVQRHFVRPVCWLFLSATSLTLVYLIVVTVQQNHFSV